MFESSPVIGYILIAAVTLLLYAVAWIGSRGRSMFERIAIRSGLAVLVVLPILAAVLFSVTQMGRERSVDAAAPPATAPTVGGRTAAPHAPSPSGTAAEDTAVRDRAAVDESKVAAEAAARQRRLEEPSRAADQKQERARRQAEAESALEAARQSATPPPVASARPPGTAPPVGAPRTAAPPTATPDTAPPPPSAPSPQVAPAPSRSADGGSAPPADATVAQPSPTTRGRRFATAAKPPRRWDVVPVYYGTDRKRVDNDKRADYGSERGRRLEVGRAMVTVPKSHEVPNVERPWVYKLPFTSIVLYREKEDPDRHFTLQEVVSSSQEQLAQQVRERLAASRDYKNHAFVFVHGFNNSFDSALYRTAQIAYDLKFDGAPFLYSWPSNGQLGVSDYGYDRESSGQAQPYLKDFLEFVVASTGATSVSVIAHSMGAQLLLPVLRDLKRTRPEGAIISQVILAAPDVDRDTFEFLAGEIKGVGRGITMLAASNDRALTISRRFWGGVPRAGDIPAEGPVVIAGIDTIDVTAVSTDVLAINHSGYAEKHALLNDMRLLIQTGERPPERRVPILLRVPTPRGDYWRYPDSMR